MTERTQTTPKRKAARSCTWAEDQWSGAWDTGCGKSFEITDGTPENNSMTFCCYCGRSIVQEPAKEDALNAA